MKILTLRLNDKSYMSSKISTYLTKEALKIQRDALALGEKAKQISEDNTDDAAEILDKIFELTDRKIWLNL